MKKLFMLVLTLALFSFVVPEEKKITIFMIGDSTMADKNLDKENQERGWGQALPMHLQGNIVVDNHAQNGRSSKSFIDEGRWDKVLNSIKPGDYVFIQFGHNDEKADESRHTDPHTSFGANLTRFIRETKAKGGNPVIYNSIVRRKFVDGVLTDTHGEYITVPEQVAKAEGVPFVNANAVTHKLVEAFGDEASKRMFMWIEPGKYEFCPNGKHDDTHLNVLGADIVSDLLIRATVKEVPALAPYVKPEVNVEVKPTDVPAER